MAYENEKQAQDPVQDEKQRPEEQFVPEGALFGLPNSGIVSEYSLFKLEAASAENGLFYTVNFGVEGSVGAILLLSLLAAAILVINRGRGEKNDAWAEKPAA